MWNLLGLFSGKVPKIPLLSHTEMRMFLATRRTNLVVLNILMKMNLLRMQKKMNIQTSLEYLQRKLAKITSAKSEKL